MNYITFLLLLFISWGNKPHTEIKLSDFSLAPNKQEIVNIRKKKSFYITRRIFINEEMNYSKAVSHINQILYFRDTVTETKSHKNFGQTYNSTYW